MKRVFCSAFLMVIMFSISAQVPQAFKYQAVARDASNNLISGQTVSVLASIVKTYPGGTTIYSEYHSVSTNQFGLFSINIGMGTQITGNFSNIEWGTDTYFLKIETDLAGGTNYQVMGISQLLSVPYALYANTTGDTTIWRNNGDMAYYNKGKVGIGTTSPVYDLEVADTTAGGFADIGLSAKDAHGALAVYPSTLAAPFGHFANRMSLFSSIFTSSGLDLRADGLSSDIRFYTGGPFAVNERMRIDSAGHVSIGTTSSNGNLTIQGESGLNGIRINNPGYYGVSVISSAQDGIYVTDAGTRGLLVSFAGAEGVFVTFSGSDWGFYAYSDKTYSSGGYYPAQTASFAVNSGMDILEPGDLVSISGGYEEDVLGAKSPIVVNVAKANGKNSQSLLGVVESRVYVHEKTDETTEGKSIQQKSFRFMKGKIDQGEYLSVIITGIAEVKVNPEEFINSGELLAAGEGYARKLQTRTIEGMIIAENTGILGKTLEDSKGKDKIKVFVNCK